MTTLSETSQRQAPHAVTHVWDLEDDTDEADRESRPSVAEGLGEAGGRMAWELGVSRRQLLQTGRINKQVLL